MQRNFVVGLLGGLIGATMLLIVLSAAGIVGADATQVQADVGRRQAVSAATPLSSTFTYQGQVKQGNAPVNGLCDLAFRLYDAAIGGNLVGSAMTATIPVTNGLFTAQLDFGANVFNGDVRWIDLQVRCPTGVGGFTALNPRQPITPAPYALTALSTAYKNVLVVAKSGGNYNTINDALNSIGDNSAANHYLIYVAPGTYTETVTMKPYVDIEGSGELTTKITQVGSSSSLTGTVVGADNAELRFLTVENTGGPSVAFATAIYNNSTSPRLTHLTVIADPGPTSCGVDNLNASTPTLTDVTITAYANTYNYGIYNSASSPVLVNVIATATGGFITAGVYNDNGSSPSMLNVTARASQGQGNVYGIYDNSASAPTMTNVSASASGNNYGVYGVYNSSSSPRMTNVAASASDGKTNYGVYDVSSSSPLMMNVIITVSGGVSTTNYGVWNDSSSPIMMNVPSSASGGSATNYGVYNQNSSAPMMTDVAASASGGSATNYGMYNSGSSPTMKSSTATASGGSHDYGVWNDTSSLIILNSTISASGGINDGLHNVASSGAYTVTINNSQVTGNTSTIYQSSTAYTTKVGASQLAGGGAFGGNYICVFTYNGNYAALNSTCQ